MKLSVISLAIWILAHSLSTTTATPIPTPMTTLLNTTSSTTTTTSSTPTVFTMPPTSLNTVCLGVPEWSSTEVYVAGNTVRYQGYKYTSKWWTLNEKPGTIADWSVWTNQTLCG